MNAYKQTLYAMLIRIAANVLMLGAVFLAMYRASLWSAWPAEAVFCAWFFGMTIPVWTGAFMLTRTVRQRFPAEQTTFIDLPRRGRQLVSWHVVQDTAPQGCVIHR